MTASPANYRHLNRMRLLATLPVLVAAVITTGVNYLQALALNEGVGNGGWRDSLVRSWVNTANSPDLVATVVAGLVHLVPVLLLAIIVAGFWERIFSVARGRPFNRACIVIAVLFTMLSHPAIPLFHVVFGLSFAMVFGYAVFGGDGKTFLAPALVGAVVVQVSFPGALNDHPIWTGLNGHDGTNLLAAYHQQGQAALEWNGLGWWDLFMGAAQGMMGSTAIPAIMLGAAILVAGHLASLRLLAGLAVGMLAGSLICLAIAGGDPAAGILNFPWHWHLITGGLVFAMAFIATDPTASCGTNHGRWIQGILTGLLVVLVRVVNPAHPDGINSVLLLVSVLAPVIDHGVTWFNIRRRMRVRLRT